MLGLVGEKGLVGLGLKLGLCGVEMGVCRGFEGRNGLFGV